MRPLLPAVATLAAFVLGAFVLGAFVLGACGGGPRAVADWRMVDRTVDRETDQRGEGDVDTPGPDGVVDDYENAQGRLLPGVNGNISTPFPDDGRYEVELDACGSTGGTRYTWAVDQAAPFDVDACKVRVRLGEGSHTITLTVRDASGTADTVPLAAEVKDLIVVGLGDSFSSGSGASRSGLVAADYDQIHCTRSGHSGQARAALEMERRDARTSVTFIHLACGGARTLTGLLGPHNGQPPQILELGEMLPAGQAVDFLSFTIGGNDIEFSSVVGQLVQEPDAPLTSLKGAQVHEGTQRRLLELREKLAAVAACFGAGFEGRPCEVRGPSGRDDDEQVLTASRIPLAAPSRVVHVTYPDLTTYFGAGGALETCPSGAVERPGDLLDGLMDGLVNGGPLDDPRPLRLSRSEWSWGDATVLQPSDPALSDAAPATYLYLPESGGATVPLPVLNTLNSVVMESGPRFGWTSSSRWWRDTRGHGYCAPASENDFFRTIFHPNDAGHVALAAGLVAEAERLGVVPASR